ncbi:hypothetical protein QR305_02280 [Bacteroides finegoldii]|jgi:hypothetical protein|uniref:Uncharacterized protein n=1 Tax=Bacteroides finegoldii CL09T03C10 TaxID=997888 RepID=K5CRJ5_9BACE|nr:hypothetical protein [Bacteroides finegoldii]EKJ92025.1 hypothetical protein HMPREF1057_00860 [Bacteroides finegoldii CL09T03C10]
MNLTIDQKNLHLILPSKVSWVAGMLAEDRNMSTLEAVKAFYTSETYKQLEKEETKMWHLGPVALYQSLLKENL